MPLSTPVSAEIVATPTASTTRRAWAVSPWSTPSMMSRPTLSMTTPMPRLVATPKMVPTTVATSTASPAAPLMRLPSSGCRAERTASGRPLRWAK